MLQEHGSTAESGVRSTNAKCSSMSGTPDIALEEKQAKPVLIAPPATRFGVRHAQTLLMAFSSFTIYLLRINLSVAIVAMVGMDESNASVNVKSNASTDVLPMVTVPPERSYPVYDWDEQVQGLVLSSFFWGYMLTQLPAGVLTQRLGGHRFLYCALFLASLLTVLLPPCAYIGGWRLVCLNRMLQGVAQGAVYPSIFTMMGLWAPTAERSTLAGAILGAQTLGPVVATPVAGLLLDFCGWPWVFYLYGAVGLAYSFVVMRFGADSPSAHRGISEEERAYILASLGQPSKAPTPWRSILRSGPAWAAIMTMALQGGVFLAFLTKMPTYLSTVLKFEIKENGLLTALPYLVSWLLSFPFSSSCDWFVRRGYLSLTRARKLYNSISHVLSAVCMVALGFCTDTALSVVLLTICIGVMSASYPGVQSNFMDLTPNFSGTVFSISNFLSAVAGVLGPIIISFIVTEKGSVSQWRTVYCLLAAMMLLSNLHFLLLGSAKVQPWNNLRPERGDDEETVPEDELRVKGKTSEDHPVNTKTSN